MKTFNKATAPKVCHDRGQAPPIATAIPAPMAAATDCSSGFCGVSPLTLLLPAAMLALGKWQTASPNGERERYVFGLTRREATSLRSDAWLPQSRLTVDSCPAARIGQNVELSTRCPSWHTVSPNKEVIYFRCEHKIIVYRGRAKPQPSKTAAAAPAAATSG